MKNFAIIEEDSKSLSRLLGVAQVDIVVKRSKVGFPKKRKEVKKGKALLFTVIDSNDTVLIPFLGVEALISGNRVIKIHLEFLNKQDKINFEKKDSDGTATFELKRILSKILTEGKKIPLD